MKNYEDKKKIEYLLTSGRQCTKRVSSIWKVDLGKF